MADQVLSEVDNAVHCGGTAETEDHYAEEALYPAAVVTTAGSTSGQVHPANGGVADENVYGVAGVPLGADPDTVIPIGNPVPVFRKGSGSVVWVKLMAAAGPVPINAGDILIVATEDGKVSKADESSVAAKAGFVVGVAQHDHPGHATDDKYIRVKI